MANFTQLNAVFPGEGLKPYDQNGIREIETCRRTFNGVLFVDRILRALGIDSKVYPPKGDNGLRTLHQQICDAQIPPHPKLSIFYYLLCDYDGLRGIKSALADEFALNTALPRKYQTLMKGLWHMDRSQFRFALDHLAHPSLPSEFADDIIIVLIQHSDPGDYSLALAYFHATQPVLQSNESLELLFAALARTSVTDALYFSRKYHQSAQRQLFEKLLSSVLEEQIAGRRAKELVSLPLNNTEDKWLQEFLGIGEGRKSKNARAILELRNIVTGRQRGLVTSRGFGHVPPPAPLLARPARGGR